MPGWTALHRAGALTEPTWVDEPRRIQVVVRPLAWELRHVKQSELGYLHENKGIFWGLRHRGRAVTEYIR